MIFDLLSSAWSESELDAVFEAFTEGKRVKVSGLKAAAKSFCLTLLAPRLRMPVVWVTASAKQAEERWNDLLFLEKCFHPERASTGSRIVSFPAPDSEPYQGVGPHPQISVQRMQALWQLNQSNVEVLVLPVHSVLRVLPPPQ